MQTKSIKIRYLILLAKHGLMTQTLNSKLMALLMVSQYQLKVGAWLTMQIY